MLSTHGRGDDSDHAAIVDQLLRKLRPAQFRTGSATRVAVSGADRPSTLGIRSVTPAGGGSASARQAGVWARVGLGVLLTIALPQWPYGRGCDAPLFLYLAAVATVIVTGVWGAVFSWRNRLGPAHLVALTTILCGFVLITHEVLPRVGYARTGATWRCSAPRASIPTGHTLPTPAIPNT